MIMFSAKITEQAGAGTGGNLSGLELQSAESEAAGQTQVNEKVTQEAGTQETSQNRNNQNPDCTKGAWGPLWGNICWICTAKTMKKGLQHLFQRAILKLSFKNSPIEHGQFMVLFCLLPFQSCCNHMYCFASSLLLCHLSLRSQNTCTSNIQIYYILTQLQIIQQLHFPQAHNT